LPKYQLWEDFPPAQISALSNLLDELTSKYNIQKVLYSPNMIDYETSDSSLNSFSGILGHSVIADYKWDPGPALMKRLEDSLGL